MNSIDVDADLLPGVPAVTVAERSFRNIAQSERQMRRQAERAMHEYVRLLTNIANHFAGQALENEHKSNPLAVESWMPEQWEAFFTREVFLKSGLGWGGPAGRQEKGPEAPPDAHGLAALQRLLGELQARLSQALKELEALQKAAYAGAETGKKVLPGEEERREPLVPGEPLLDDIARLQARRPPPQSFPSGPAAGIERLIAPPPVNEEPRGHAGIVEELRRWQAPAIPVRFRQLAQVTEERWQRQSMALYLLARYGLSCRLEIDALLSQASDADRRTSPVRKAVDQLPELGLVKRDVLEVTIREGITSRLVVMDLSEQGRDLCAIFNWPVIESDWARAARVYRGSGEHLMGVFFLVAQARLRGYQALVFPPPFSPAAADALLARGDEKRLAYVELGQKESRRWLLGDAPPGPLAFFTLTPQARMALVGSVRQQAASHPGLAQGAAADLESLIEVKKITLDAPLWVETWTG